jgi:hypothetical protein
LKFGIVPQSSKLMAFGTMEYNKEVECGEKEGGGKGGKEGRYKCG